MINWSIWFFYSCTQAVEQFWGKACDHGTFLHLQISSFSFCSAMCLVKQHYFFIHWIPHPPSTFEERRLVDIVLSVHAFFRRLTVSTIIHLSVTNFSCLLSFNPSTSHLTTFCLTPPSQFLSFQLCHLAFQLLSICFLLFTFRLIELMVWNFCPKILSCNSILYPLQSGFCPLLPTETF